MSSVQDAFKHNRAKKNVMVTAGLILTCITLLSCVSSFQIYREGFANVSWFAQQAIALFAVIVVEGAFIWLLYGFSRAFSSLIERVVSLAGLVFIVCVMLTNIVTHFMMVKNLPLNSFQQAWLSWGAVSVFIAVLVVVLIITMADPLSKLHRQELRIQGKQQETILYAREEGLGSQDVELALDEAARLEGRFLADQIISSARQIGSGSTVSNVRMPQTQGTFRRPSRARRPMGKGQSHQA